MTGPQHYGSARLTRLALILIAALFRPMDASAQTAPQATPAPAGANTAGASEAAPAPEDWAIHGQATFLTQYHPAFPSAFSGPNSLTAKNQARETFDLTLFGGVRPWQGGEIWVNPEVDQGFGLSTSLGVVGFTSGTAFKVGAANPYARLPRVFLRQTIDLGGETENVEATANQLAGSQTANRLVITAGKFGATDVFDRNKYANDPRGDFLNWALINTGSFDYAADAWGFTYGAAAEWYQDWWTIRGGLFNLSKIPNSKALETTAFDEYQSDLELEERHKLWGQPGALRVLGFLSHGRMGKYNDATALAEETGAPADIALVRKTHDKGGVSLNFEQQITDDLGVFSRVGWSHGQYEAFDYTDINQTVAGGISVNGNRWQRPDDTIGLAMVRNDASDAAKRFFAAGGLGILAGDGRLPHPGAEYILETYYKFDVHHVANLTLDYQYIQNPAYDRDRGPVSVFGLRVHAAF